MLVMAAQIAALLALMGICPSTIMGHPGWID
jgi:hypothetical protein